MGNLRCVIMVIWLIAVSGGWAETNSVPSDEDRSWQSHVIQSYQTIQEQQQATQRAVEEARREAEMAAKRNAEAFENRFRQMEQGLTVQREREVESLQASHRFTLILVGVVAGAGFFGMLLVALFLLRTMNRRPAMMAPSIVREDTMALAPLDPVQQGGARFRASFDRLEQRLNELETTAQTGEIQAVAESPHPVPDISARVSLLLGKGQALLNLQQADTATACFDEVIALDPTNAEAFVKKGTALEKLGRLDDAIDCYDRAIVLDTTMTMAYLCKGGVFNRLERYGEALQCYEQALRAQHKSAVT